MRSSLLDGKCSVRHGITGRLPGVMPADGNIGYGAPRDKEAAWRERQLWSIASGVDSSALSTAHQVHGNRVIVVGAQDRGRGGKYGSSSLGEADALVTSTPGVAIMTLHADCLPIIIADPALPAVGVIHAGWRGTVANVAGATVKAMCDDLGAETDRLVVLFGPAIRSCCYEIGDEVVSAWREISGADADTALDQGTRRYHLDLVRANTVLLQRSGVSIDRIDDQAHCTSCNSDRWFSHRAQGPGTGRFGAIAGIAPDNAGDSTTWF